MELEKNTIKKLLGLITFAVLLYWGLQNLEFVGELLGLLLGLLSPFLIGLGIAFVLNVPMRAVERVLFRAPVEARGVRSKRAGRAARLYARIYRVRRPISLLVTLLLLLGVLAAAVLIIVPEMIHTFELIGQNVPHFIAQVQQWTDQIVLLLPELETWIGDLQIDWQGFDWKGMVGSFLDFLQSGAGSFLSSTMSIAASFFSGLFSFFLGSIFAIYILSQKEKLGRQLRRTVYAVLSEPRAERMVSVARLTDTTFSRFLSGQCVESVILGTMFFITLSLLRFPYALLISVLVGVTSLIPVFGAFIGCVVGAFLILIVNPMQALWFVVVFLILQQVEGNLIYPRVVGNSVGLPAIWVLFAVTVGGSTMGVLGMLITIPLCSVLYALTREAIVGRLKKKKLEGRPEVS